MIWRLAGVLGIGALLCLATLAWGFAPTGQQAAPDLSAYKAKAEIAAASKRAVL